IHTNLPGPGSPLKGCATALRVWLFVLFLYELRDGDDVVALLDVDESDALRGATDGAHVVGLHPQDHALLRDQQHLVALLHVGDADHDAVAIARGDVDDTDPAARLHAVFLDLGSLAVAAFGHREQRTARAHHFHCDDQIVVSQRERLALFSITNVSAEQRKPLTLRSLAKAHDD